MDVPVPVLARARETPSRDRADPRGGRGECAPACAGSSSMRNGTKPSGFPGRNDVTMPQTRLGPGTQAAFRRLAKGARRGGGQGHALFEVETDKATMEVEAQAGGDLTAITDRTRATMCRWAAVIARISRGTVETGDGDGDPGTPHPPPRPEPRAPEAGAALPRARPSSVTMPQLGMAQDLGPSRGLAEAPGEAVAADDLLFEVETDKRHDGSARPLDGYLAATLAQAGEEGTGRARRSP